MFDFVFNATQLGDFLATGVRLSVPIGFAAMGGMLCERAGVFNVALEGQLLFGAFAAAVGAYFFGAPAGGILMAVLVGALSGVLLSVLGVTMRVNQIVVGISIILLASGLTSFLSRVVFPQGSNSLSLSGFKRFGLPVLDQIPVLGTAFFTHDILVYAMLVVAVLLHLTLKYTSWGLAVRATGESPAAADAAGAPVFLIRYGCVIIGSILASVGGAYVVLSQVFLFSDNMTHGKGFIALAAIVLGRWAPFTTLIACLLFGVFDAYQLRLQALQPEVPFQLFAALPYLIAIVALVGLIGQIRAPAAVGQFYDREMR
ncbi:MAG: ABC transporter permease [Parvibaculaceae bacterium]